MKILLLVVTLGVAGALLSCRQDTPEPRAETICVLCEKPIPEGKEVFLVTADGQSQPYRCIHCALTAQAAAPPPSTITVHAPLSKTAITIRRDEQGWSVNPAAAVFLSLPEEEGECMDRHCAFPDQDEYRRYLDAHPELSSTAAVPYTIEQLADLLASGLPAGGIRPDASVQLLVVGMLTHLPFKQKVLPAIEGALSDVGDFVGAQFVDATRPEGKAILSAHGIHEHLPVVMFLKGSSRAEWKGQTVELRGFPGKGWSRESLAAVLRQERGKQAED